MILYLDDGIGSNFDFDFFYLDFVFVAQTIIDAGFLVNIEKSIKNFININI